MSDNYTTSKVKAVLTSLGATASEVALSLKQKGIKGKKGHSCNCPIANYLRQQGFRYPSVSRWEIDADDVGVPTSNAISTFIARFDDGMYPELQEV